MPPLKDTSLLISVLRKQKPFSTFDQSIKIDHQREQPMSPGQYKWSEGEDSMLYDAMRLVCEQHNRQPPTRNEQLASLVDGQFADASTRDFWRAVSQQVPTRSAMSCYLRYRHIYSASVARFTSPTCRRTANDAASPYPPLSLARSQLQRRPSNDSST